MQGRFRVNRVIEWHIIIGNFQLFPPKYRTPIAKISGLSKNVRQIHELLSLIKISGLPPKSQGYRKKKKTVAIAGYR